MKQAVQIERILAEQESFAHAILNNCSRVRELLPHVYGVAPKGARRKGLTKEHALILKTDFKNSLLKRSKRV